MNSLLFYLLKVILCSGVLFGYYYAGLRNKTFHQWNRFYLLACVVISLTAPLLKINIQYFSKPASNSVFHVLNTVTESSAVEVENHSTRVALDPQQWSLLSYIIVSVIFLSIIIRNGYRIYKILRAYPKTKLENICFLNTDAKGTPFAFFHYIVWNRAIDLNTDAGQRIFQHELVHVQQRHTWDKVFLLLILIPFWCNPFFWLIRKELSALHEFAADQKAMQSLDASVLAHLILNTTFPEQNFLFTNHLFQSTIKRRLIMFTKLQNPKVNYRSRVVALPLLLLVIASFALKARPLHRSTLILNAPITVMIDPGHGIRPNGDYDGARWQDIYEDDIVLAIAKKIKQLNANSNIRILLTREDNQTVDLHKRVDLAAENKADLFISIHVNATDGALNGQIKTPVNGMQVVVSSKNPPYQPQSEILASALVQQLNSVYTTQTNLIKPTTGVWVIDHNVCPAVLIECGYLTDKNDRDFITRESNQTLIANKILDAIEQYAVLKNSNRATSKIDTLPDRVYNTKRLSDVQYFEHPKQEVHLFYADGSKDTISYEEAKAANLFDSTSLVQIEQRPWENKKDTQPNFKTGDFTVRKATVQESNNFKGVILLNDKVFKGSIQQLPSTPEQIASISIIKGGSAFPELNLQPDDSVLSITTKSFLKANTKSDGNPKNEPLFTQTEVEPRFPDANGGWKVFLQKNLNTSVAVMNDAKPGSYKVEAGFIVDPEGKLYDIKPLTHFGHGMEDEVVRLMKLSPDWIPAMQNGKKVTTYKKQAVTFVIQKA